MSKNLSRRSFLKGAAAVTAGAFVTQLSGKAVADEPNLYTPGTYEAVVAGYCSYLTVTMTFDANTITACTIKADGETTNIGTVAAQEYAQLIVNNQDVDAVTSASAAVTLPAAKKGVENCIAQAKGEAQPLNEAAAAASGDWLGEAPVITDNMIASTRKTDLLIVGAGNAGMMAAATAAEAGMDFILCEKNAAVGSTRFWVGAMNSDAMKAAGLEVSETKALNELIRYASNKCDAEVIRAWIDHSAESLRFLETLGVTAELHADLGNHVGGNEMTYFVPSQWHTLHATGKYEAFEINSFMGANRNPLLEQYIKDQGYEVSFQMDLVRLTQDESGRVTGAIFANAHGEYEKIEAKNTILATGGYAGNPRMVKALSPIVNDCVTTALYAGANTGMGIKAGIWAGAKKDTECAPMIFDRGLVSPDSKAGYVEDEYGALYLPGDTTYAQTNMGSQPFLKVNKEGKRFTNESCPYDFMSFAASLQTDGVYACIFDNDIVEDILEYKQYGCAKWTYTDAQAGILPTTIDGLVESGMLFRCDTIEELALKLQVPVETFKATVERYNALCQKGVDEDFGKEAYRMRAIDHAPYYGGFFGGSLLCTCDGLRVNGKGQVYSADNHKIIEGLYSAGNCSGSFFSGNYPEYFVGIAVSRAMTQGRQAVKAILAENT